MDTAYQSLLLVHGLCGLVALVTFWIAAFAKKGAPLHLRAGKIFMIAMLGIVVTAVPMAAIISTRGKPGIATFLAYLVVITLTAMWLGWRAVKRKRDQNAFRDNAYLAVALINRKRQPTPSVIFVFDSRRSQPFQAGEARCRSKRRCCCGKSVLRHGGVVG